MAVNEFTGSGKWSAGVRWSKAAAPKASEDAVIAEGATCKIEAASVCRGLVVKKTAKVEGSSGLTVGNSEEPEPTGYVGYALKVEAGATVSYSGKISLASTWAGEPKIDVLSEVAGSLMFKEKTSASKYQLVTELKLKGRIEQNLPETFLKTNGAAITAESWGLGAAKSTVELGASVVTLTGKGVASPLAVFVNVLEESTFTASESTIVFTQTKAYFESGTVAYTYGTLKFENTEQEYRGNNTTVQSFKKLAVTKAGAVIKFGPEEFQPKLKLEELEIVGSVKATLTTLEAQNPGKIFTLEFTKAVTVKNLKLKDCHATAAHEPTVEYEGVTEGELKGTNVEHWIFKAAAGAATAKGTTTFLFSATEGTNAKMTALATTAVLFKDQAATATKQTAKSTAVIKFTTNGAIAAKGTATGVSLIRFVAAGAQASKIGAAGATRVLFTATAATQTASAAHTGGVALFRFATNTPSGLNKKATHGETQILFAAHAATAKAGVATATGTSLLSFKTEAVSAQHQVGRGQSQIIFSDAGRAVPAKQAAIGTTNVKLSAAAAQASKVTSTGSATVKFSASAATSSSGAAHAAATSLIRFGVNTPSALSKKTANGETRILFRAQAGTAKTGSATAAATASLLFKAQAAPVQKQTVKGQSQVKFSTSGAVVAHLTFNGSAGLIFRQSLGTEVKRSATASATANIRFAAVLKAREGRGSESLGLPAIVEPGEREGRTSPFSSAGIVQPVPGRLVP